MRIILALCALLASAALAGASPLPCHPAADAGDYAGKDVCISAHVYDVVELTDGTRFLDVCSPETADEDCRFSIVSYPDDWKHVGDLSTYAGKDIEIRGTVHSFHGREQIVLSRTRQFHGGREKFQPNPALLRGFSAESGRTAFSDPALRGGRHRSAFLARHF